MLLPTPDSHAGRRRKHRSLSVNRRPQVAGQISGVSPLFTASTADSHGQNDVCLLGRICCRAEPDQIRCRKHCAICSPTSNNENPSRPHYLSLRTPVATRRSRTLSPSLFDVVPLHQRPPFLAPHTNLHTVAKHEHHKTNSQTHKWPHKFLTADSMYRSAARRLLPALFRRPPVRFNILHQSPFSEAAASEHAQNHGPNHFEPSNSSSFSSSNEARKARVTAQPKAHWQEEQERVLRASLRHVIRLGWSDVSMIAGAREIGISPSIVGSFPRKEAALVEFFMDECLQRLIDIIDKEDLSSLIPSDRVIKLVRIRLEMQAPYISKWPQALTIQAQPLNVSTSFKQRAMLIDEIWHAAGDDATDIDWYVKRTVLGGIYSATELYMLTDNSSDFQETWAFLDARVRGAFDLKKSVQEVKYLAETMGAGMGGHVQGFMKNIFRG